MRKFTGAALIAVIWVLAASSAALADGTETLGPPSITVEAGTSVLAAGVGMEAFPGTLNSFSVTLPTGAVVRQVLLYWEGHHSSPAFAGGDSLISINGTPVAGTLIGGPTAFFTQFVGPTSQQETFSAYRADITSHGLIGAGTNTLTVSEMQFASNFPLGGAFNQGNDGAGVLVIYDDGTDSTAVGIRDGLDMAYKFFAAPLDAAVPQTFTFTSAPSPRPANLATLAGSVRGPDVDKLRGNILHLTFDVGGTADIVNPWQSNDGFAFDALNTTITIPAGASSLTVQPVSEGPFDEANQPASFAWVGATLAIQNPPRGGGQGCTPGYWKNHDGSKKQTNQWIPTGYSPTQALSTVFSPASLGTLGSATMRQALDWGGGSTLDDKKRLLLHHAVAALLNAAHPSVSYPMTTAQIISAVDSALLNSEAAILNLKDLLDMQNNAGCPIGN